MTLHIRGLSTDFVSIHENAKDCLHIIKDDGPDGDAIERVKAHRAVVV